MLDHSLSKISHWQTLFRSQISWAAAIGMRNAGPYELICRICIVSEQKNKQNQNNTCFAVNNVQSTQREINLGQDGLDSRELEVDNLPVAQHATKTQAWVNQKLITTLSDQFAA